jgi:MFS family permease
LILYLVRYVHIGPAVLGVLLGCGFVGGLAGSVLTSRIGRRIGVGPAYIAGCVLFTAPLLLVPSAAGPQPFVFALVLVAVFLAGFGVMMLDINAGAIRAALVPSHLLARVSGAYSFVNYGVRPVGSVAGGALAVAIGVRSTLFIVAAGAVLGVLWLLPSPLPALRELPQTGGQPEALPAAVEPVPDATR